MQLNLNTSSQRDYQLFIRLKSLPKYSFTGTTATFPDEYAGMLGLECNEQTGAEYQAFDYQKAISEMVIEKEKFAVFADCGLGKTLIMLEAARHWLEALDGKSVLIVSPLMVVRQTISEAAVFYKDLNLRQVKASELSDVLPGSSGEILITNYEALRDDTPQGNIGALILDESSMLKSHYGKWGQSCLRLGAGLKYKLALTGTPAPNDRIEYANHAVFLDAFTTVNSFLARYFVNRGQTDNRWELKPHALEPFYRSLSHWAIFISNPATYGWKDNCETIPPIHIHIHDISLTKEQQALAFEKTGSLFADQIGGITSRSVLSQIAKGSYRGNRIETNKPAAIAELVETWPEESTIIWCKYNAEQEIIAEQFPAAHSIDGSTTYEDRESMINDFKSGKCKVMISKPKILGFGLNLQIATRQVFSGLQDSYEEFYQAVKRSNRYGSSRPLNVHIPVTDIERPMIETVLAKAKRVQHDTDQQERIFHDNAE